MDIVTRLILNTTGFTGPAVSARKVFRETTESITREAAAASQRVREAAEARVRTGGHEGRLLYAVREEARVRQEELRVAKEIAAARKAAGVEPTAASQRVRRTEEEQLARIPELLRRIAAEEVRTGQSRAAQIERLLKLQAALNARIAQQKDAIQRVRDASFIGPMLPGGGRGAAGGGVPFWAFGGLGSSLAHGLQDAAISAQFLGARGSAIAISNNLPMIGEGFGRLGERIAEAGGKAAGFGAVLARFAGPAGLIASVAVPLGALLIPSLLRFGRASDDAKKKANEFGDSLRRIDEIGLASRRRPIDGFRTVEDLKELASERKFQRETAEERLERLRGIGPSLAGLEQSRHTAISKDVVDELNRRIMAADPTFDSGFIVDSWNQERIEAGRAAIPEEILERARKQEAAILDARLELRHAIEAEAETVKARAEAEGRDKFVDAVAPYFGRVGEAAARWWRSVEETKERQDAVKEAADRFRALIDPKEGEIAELAEDIRKRREAIREAFPQGGARAAELLAMADRAEAAERKRIDERFAERKKKPERVRPDLAFNRAVSADSVDGLAAIARATQGVPVSPELAELQKTNALQRWGNEMLAELRRLLVEIERHGRNKPVVASVGRDR